MRLQFQSRMPEILTRDFGLISSESNAELHFPNGLPGFEDQKRFVLLEKENLTPIVLLQSLQTPSLCFLAISVHAVDPGYQIGMTREDQLLLGVPLGAIPETGWDEVGSSKVTSSRATSSQATPSKPIPPIPDDVLCLAILSKQGQPKHEKPETRDDLSRPARPLQKSKHANGGSHLEAQNLEAQNPETQRPEASSSFPSGARPGTQNSAAQNEAQREAGFPLTANLLAPVFINLRTHTGVQAVRADRRYSHRHPLGERLKCW
jgi:flagellar assembly factor FliW